MGDDVSVSEFVTIDRADNEAVADLIRQRLDQGGIPCVLVPSNIAVVAGAAASFAVTVPADRADEARALLRE
jgi:Putative prokaryotic signal transducing protein